MRRAQVAAGDSVEEREVKLAVDDDFVVPPLSGLSGVTVVDHGDERLHAVYWDTADLGLARAGVGMRHRNGVWTCKSRSRRDGDALVREEVEVPGDPGVVPDLLRARVARHVDALALRPVAELDTLRHVFDIAAPDERAELVHDRVRVLDAGREVAHFAEVEVEFEADSGALAERLVRLLVDSGATVVTGSKYARALHALGHVLPPTSG